MDIATLKRKVDECLAKKPSVFSGAAFGSPAITKLLTAVCEADAFTLADGTKKDGADHVVVTGKLAKPFAGASEGRAVLTFTIVADKAALRAEIDRLPASWKPSVGFAGLKGTVYDYFTLTSPKLILDTAKPPALPAGFPVSVGARKPYPAAVTGAMVPGLGLAGMLQTSSDDIAAWLLGGKQWQVSGPMVVPGSQLSAVLSTAPGKPVNLAGLRIPFRLHLVTHAFVSAPPEKVLGLRCLLQLSGETTADLGGNRTLPLSFVLRTGHPRTAVTTLTAQTAPGTVVTAQELAKLLGATALDALPTGFPALADAGLRRVELRLPPQARTPLSIAATIGWAPAKPYGVWDGLLTFSGLDATFTCYPATAERDLRVETSVTGRADLAGGRLEMSLALPSGTLSCAMAQGTAVDITAITKKALGSTMPPGMSSVTCTEFALTGDVKAGFYAFSATVNDWVVKIGSGQLKLTNVCLASEKTAKGVTGEIGCRAALGGLTLAGRARYGTTDGWSFELGTIDSSGATLSTLARELATAFGWTAPTAVPDVAVSSARVEFATATGQFYADCAATLRLDDFRLTMGVAVSRTSFQGFILVGGVLFAMDLTKYNPGEMKLTAAWTAAPKESRIGAADIARAFGLPPPELPKALDVRLSSARVAIDLKKREVAAYCRSETHGEVAFVLAGKPKG